MTTPSKDRTMANETKHTAHTPGPWSVPHFAEPDTNCSCGYVLTDSGMGAVCTVHCSGEGDDWAKHGDNPKFAQACANARLIAAAPDLLEAVQSIWSAWLRTDPGAAQNDVFGCAKAIARATTPA